MKKLCSVIPRTNIRFSTERTNRHRVLIQRWQVVAEGSIHVANAVKFWRHETREGRDEASAHKRVEQILAAVELRHDDTLAVVNARQRDVKLSINP